MGRWAWRNLVLLAGLGASGCGGKDDPPAETPAGETASVDSGVGLPPSMVPTSCEPLGLEARPFDASGSEVGLRRLAPDFTVPTVDGDWTLSAQWSGCDTYLFVPSAPRQADGTVPLWERDQRDLLDELPLNVHVFFVSSLDAKKDVDAEIEALSKDLSNKLDNLDPARAEALRPRLHYLTKGVPRLEGWVGDRLRNPNWGFFIDRLQVIRDIGSLANHERYNDSIGWFESDLSQVANEALYSNFLAEREADLAARPATVIRSFDRQFVDDSGWAGVQGYATVALPDPATLATFDTLELDLATECGGEAEYGTCPAWDRIVNLYACDVPVSEANPHRDTPCQPYVPGTPGLPETLGQCYLDKAKAGPTCRTVDDCLAETGIDTGTTSTSSAEDTGTTTSPGAWSCVGYVPEDPGVPAVPAETRACACTTPIGEEREANFTCRADGSGFDDCACPCNTEMGRWITTYHREGRWVHDASYALPFLQAGGTQKLAFYTIDPWEITLDFRLSNSGRGARPVKTIPLWGGGSFGPDYNDLRPPIEVTIPDGTRRVELSVVLTGHGMESPGNCAEFCNIVHTFGVNGRPLEVQTPEVADPIACQTSVDEGTVPNQYGTWFYGRHNWCPGREVAPMVFDLTADAPAGSTATLTYSALFNGEPYPHGGPSIALTSWLTFWE